MFKERSILFSALMISALLAGNKSQTRRICKHQYWSYSDLVEENENGNNSVHKCPYGKPGDVLFVKETHYRFGHWEPRGVTEAGRVKWRFVEDSPEVLFEAPKLFRNGMHHADPATKAWHKRNSLFMPKSVARIWLRVKSVHVERLMDISAEDAIAEGIESYERFPAMENVPVMIAYRNYDRPKDFISESNYGSLLADGSKRSYSAPVASFLSLFDVIHSVEKRQQNPWMWAVTFEVLSTTGRPENPLS